MTERQAPASVQEGRSAATAGWRTYRAFGLTWKTDLLWPGAVAEPGEPDADVLIQLADEAEIDSRWSGHADGLDWYLRIDDELMVVEPGLAGDFRLAHAGHRFHVSADGSSVACAIADSSDPWWLRLVLDTVLWSTALLRGVEALHASAVEGAHGVVAFLSRSGGGKTTLALEFLRRDYRLFCDDVLALRRDDGAVTAHPSPNVLNVPMADADRGLPIKPIARLGDEIWSIATHASRRPAPLRHLILLDRAKGASVGLSPVPSSVFELRQFCLAHGLVPERERARFDLCADLAANVRVSRLRADVDTRPGELADLIETAVERAGAAS